MNQKRNRRGLVWLLAIVVVLAGAGGGLYFSGMLPFGAEEAQAEDGEAVADNGGDGEPEAAAVPVELTSVERRSIASFYRAASVIEADRLVDLVAKIQGRVRTVNVEEGDWVHAGQVLTELENDRERIQVRQAELKLTEQGRALERQEAMQAEGLISAQAFDDARHAFELAEAERDLAKVALEETIIRAPFAGQITARRIVAGQMIQPAAPLYTLADFEPLRVRVHLPENVARKVASGQRVLVTPEGVGEELEARIERVAPVVDPATSTVQLTLLLDEGGEKALVGGFVKVRITTETSREALSVPKLALVEEGGLRSVFVAEADTVRKVEINTGLYDETHIEVLDGLNPEQYVVSLGQGGLRTGTRIEVLNGLEVGWTVAEADTAATADAETLVALQPADVPE